MPSFLQENNYPFTYLCRVPILSRFLEHNSNAERDAARGAERGAARGNAKEDKGSSSDAADDEESRRHFKDAFSRLMGLSEEDVFRHVVGFV